MLPTVTIDLSKTCPQAFDFGRSRLSFLGYCFAYYFEQVIRKAEEARKSLDRVFTELILGGLSTHPIRREALFWFSATDDLVFLTVSDIRTQLHPMWLANLPGYMECGSDYVHPNARPFIYWDGRNATRVYPKPSEYEDGQTLLCDLGNLFGCQVGWGDQGVVDYVRAGNPEYAMYSIVPEEGQEIVEVEKRKCVLLHAFYDLKVPPPPTEEAYEDGDAN